MYKQIAAVTQLRFLAAFDSTKGCRVWLMYVSGEWLLNSFAMERIRVEQEQPVLGPGLIWGKWQIYILESEHQLSACLKAAINT